MVRTSCLQVSGAKSSTKKGGGKPPAAPAERAEAAAEAAAAEAELEALAAAVEATAEARDEAVFKLGVAEKEAQRLQEENDELRRQLQSSERLAKQKQVSAVRSGLGLGLGLRLGFGLTPAPSPRSPPCGWTSAISTPNPKSNGRERCSHNNVIAVSSPSSPPPHRGQCTNPRP